MKNGQALSLLCVEASILALLCAQYRDRGLRQRIPDYLVRANVECLLHVAVSEVGDRRTELTCQRPISDQPGLLRSWPRR